MSKDTEIPRSNYIGAPDYFILNQLCCILTECFGLCSYLVGSVLSSPDYRDIDIRTIMDHNALWSLLCCSISSYLSTQTGLKIDYQIQRSTEANKIYKGKSKQAIGFFIPMENKK